MNHQQLRQILGCGGAILWLSAVNVIPSQIATSAPLPPPRTAPKQRQIKTAPARKYYLYRVSIATTNRWVLNRVRTIEPGAFIRRSSGAIQAGLFTDPKRAKTRISQLTSLGFKSKLTALPLFRGTGNSTSRRSANSIAVINRNLKLVPHSQYYFVVIPGGDAELAVVEARLVGSGIEQQAVLIRDQPLGSHIALGPFSEEKEARVWSTYLKGKGMDARVFFDR